jgi:hypothetical protein
MLLLLLLLLLPPRTLQQPRAQRLTAHAACNAQHTEHSSNMTITMM